MVALKKEIAKAAEPQRDQRADPARMSAEDLFRRTMNRFPKIMARLAE